MRTRSLFQTQTWAKNPRHSQTQKNESSDDSSSSWIGSSSLRLWVQSRSRFSKFCVSQLLILLWIFSPYHYHSVLSCLSILFSTAAVKLNMKLSSFAVVALGLLGQRSVQGFAPAQRALRSSTYLFNDKAPKHDVGNNPMEQLSPEMQKTVVAYQGR